jgi:2'-5' RNA ligase
MLSKLKAVDPNQYYYPNEDLHTTLLSIIPCHHGFQLNQINIDDYIEVVNRCLQSYGDKLPKIRIQWKGITASTSCIMVQGFIVENDTDELNQLRDHLRKAFRETNLQQAIDIRYLLTTVHSTIVRFRAPLQSREEFLTILSNYREIDFRRFTINYFDLVGNDWYLMTKKLQILHRFQLLSESDSKET